jgi:glyoxylase-like metal-dependent hydrolase (beta-lactamase superfamily II)
MDIIQIPLSRMDTFAYLAADPDTRNCVAIDPAFDVQKIIETAEEHRYTITRVINTHNHPDHTAGNHEIMRKTGASLCIHTLDAPKLRSISFRIFTWIIGGSSSPKSELLLEDGDIIPIGQESLTVIHTPGHTPGGICLYCKGHLITGDTLFVGSVGRTDLSGGSSTQLIRSIREKIYTLPGDTIVWPGHNYGPAPTSTVGREKLTNPFTR